MSLADSQGPGKSSTTGKSAEAERLALGIPTFGNCTQSDLGISLYKASLPSAIAFRDEESALIEVADLARESIVYGLVLALRTVQPRCGVLRSDKRQLTLHYASPYPIRTSCRCVTSVSINHTKTNAYLAEMTKQEETLSK